MKDREDLGAWEYCLKDSKPKISDCLMEGDLCNVCIPMRVNIEFRAYHVYNGGGQSSGMYIYIYIMYIYIGFYIMRVNEKESVRFIISIKEIVLFSGKVVDQLSIVGDTVIYHIRLYKEDRIGFEIESDIISMNSPTYRNGKEVVLAIRPPFVNTKGEKGGTNGS